MQYFTIENMWKFLIIAGVIFATMAVFYFLRLAYYLLNSFEFTNYGFGVLTGKIILLITGVVMVYFGIKMNKNKKTAHNK